MNYGQPPIEWTAMDSMLKLPNRRGPSRIIETCFGEAGAFVTFENDDEFLVFFPE